MHPMIFKPKGEQIITVETVSGEPMYFRVDSVEIEQGEPMCDASVVAHLSPIDDQDLPPLTTRDADGNLWQLKLIGQDNGGHSIVVMLPIRIVPEIQKKENNPRGKWTKGTPRIFQIDG